MRPPLWFKIRVERTAPDGREWVLTLGALWLAELDCFGPFDEAAGPLSPAQGVGDSHRHSSGSFGQQRYAFSIAPPGPGNYVVYLRARSPLPQRFEMSLRPLATFTESSRDGWLLDGVLLRRAVSASRPTRC